MYYVTIFDVILSDGNKLSGRVETNDSLFTFPNSMDYRLKSTLCNLGESKTLPPLLQYTFYVRYTFYMRYIRYTVHYFLRSLTITMAYRSFIGSFFFFLKKKKFLNSLSLNFVILIGQNRPNLKLCYINRLEFVTLIPELITLLY